MTKQKNLFEIEQALRDAAEALAMAGQPGAAHRYRLTADRIAFGEIEEAAARRLYRELMDSRGEDKEPTP